MPPKTKPIHLKNNLIAPRNPITIGHSLTSSASGAFVIGTSSNFQLSLDGGSDKLVKLTAPKNKKLGVLLGKNKYKIGETKIQENTIPIIIIAWEVFSENKIELWTEEEIVKC